MTRSTRLSAFALAVLGVALPNLTFPTVAQAHGIAGARLFPSTLTIDDPSVSDELSLPTFTYQPGPQGDAFGYGVEIDKTLFDGLGIAFNDGYNVVHQPGPLGGNNYGWSNPAATLKYQAYRNDTHEFLAAIGVTKEFGGGGATDHGIAESVGSTQPTLYFGKGAGDLPDSVGLLRPLALTGTLGYQWSDEPSVTHSDGSFDHNPDYWNIGFSVQYNLDYLRSQVRDYGLPDIINRLIPLVEVSFSTPASHSHAGATTTGTVAPGILYEGSWYQLGVEALIPATNASGDRAGVIAQAHFFLDDIFPGSVGRPLLSRPLF